MRGAGSRKGAAGGAATSAASALQRGRDVTPGRRGSRARATSGTGLRVVHAAVGCTGVRVLDRRPAAIVTAEVEEHRENPRTSLQRGGGFGGTRAGCRRGAGGGPRRRRRGCDGAATTTAGAGAAPGGRRRPQPAMGAPGESGCAPGCRGACTARSSRRARALRACGRRRTHGFGGARPRYAASATAGGRCGGLERASGRSFRSAGGGALELGLARRRVVAGGASGGGGALRRANRMRERIGGATIAATPAVTRTVSAATTIARRTGLRRRQGGAEALAQDGRARRRMRGHRTASARAATTMTRNRRREPRQRRERRRGDRRHGRIARERHPDASDRPCRARQAATT